MSEAEPADLERARILGETAKIGWAELQRWFASGTAVYVSPELDLVETAYQLSIDNTSGFRGWLSTGLIDRVTDEQALEWLEADALVWAVVVKPWVLVQPIAPDLAH
ncbi:MAG: DUF2288 domain-containing protein [Gammaproteobacteria bacterium]